MRKTNTYGSETSRLEWDDIVKFFVLIWAIIGTVAGTIWLARWALG